jgi:hypothetical protein
VDDVFDCFALLLLGLGRLIQRVQFGLDLLLDLVYLLDQKHLSDLEFLRSLEILEHQSVLRSSIFVKQIK